MMKYAFTLIEIIFVIVILGILSAVAIPKLIATRDDAIVSKKLGQIRAISNEISSYTFSRVGSEENLSKMSNVLSEMENEGIAHIDVSQRKAKIKVGSADDCLIFTIVRGSDEENLTLSFGNGGNDPLCQMVQKNVDLRNYPIPLRGQLVKF